MTTRSYNDRICGRYRSAQIDDISLPNTVYVNVPCAFIMYRIYTIHASMPIKIDKTDLYYRSILRTSYVVAVHIHASMQIKIYKMDLYYRSILYIFIGILFRTVNSITATV
jgi:hypothetical protein